MAAGLTRRTVAPGTFFSAAALTFAAVSPVSTFGIGAGRDVEDEDDVLSFFAAAPANAAPPTAKAQNAPSVKRVLRIELNIGGLPRAGGLDSCREHRWPRCETTSGEAENALRIRRRGPRSRRSTLVAMKRLVVPVLCAVAALALVGLLAFGLVSRSEDTTLEEAVAQRRAARRGQPRAAAARGAAGRSRSPTCAARSSC